MPRQCVALVRSRARSRISGGHSMGALHHSTAVGANRWGVCAVTRAARTDRVGGWSCTDVAVPPWHRPDRRRSALVDARKRKFGKRLKIIIIITNNLHISRSAVVRRGSWREWAPGARRLEGRHGCRSHVREGPLVPCPSRPGWLALGNSTVCMHACDCGGGGHSPSLACWALAALWRCPWCCPRFERSLKHDPFVFVGANTCALCSYVLFAAISVIVIARRYVKWADGCRGMFCCAGALGSTPQMRVGCWRPLVVR